MSETVISAERAATEPVTYEYVSVCAERELESLYRDVHQSFGWIVEGYGPTPPSTGTVTLRLKRPRHIRNRPQVTELQRKAERALSQIAALEKSKGTRAFVVAMTIGIVGSGFLAGAVFALEAGRWGLSIPLGVVGLAGWLAGFLAYGRVRADRTAKVTSLIDRQYDVVYEASEQAAHLLA